MDEISVKFNSATDNLKGIFYYLKKANDGYGSRYSIHGELNDENTDCSAEDIDKYNDGTKCYWSIDNKASFQIVFDSLFYTTGYGIVNRHTSTQGNTYPKSWVLYGIDTEGELHTLDEKIDQNFCKQPNSGLCKEETIKKYKINHPQMRGYKTIFFNQTKSSNGALYLFLRAFDLYGYLCGQDKNCDIQRNTCHRNFSLKSLFYIFMLLYSNQVSFN